MQPSAQNGDALSPSYLRIDFGRCDTYEVSQMYHSFSELCAGRRVGRAMLKAGDNDPGAHRHVRDALVDLARSAQLRLDFKLALVPSTPPIAAIYREAQQSLRALGLNAWVFDNAEDAAEWLEDRSVAGRAAS